ncbi:MAG: DoxX-like family protein [Leptospirales bacterium]|nr:DoxX-like family protein [Leptospirales bacterium]
MIKWISLAFRLLAALVLAQTLFYKFTAAAESVFIFQTLGAEPAGRIAAGVIELVIVILLLIPRTAMIGSVLGAGTMLGAIASHLFVLGVVVMEDRGLLFGLAVFTLVCCTIAFLLERKRMAHST